RDKPQSPLNSGEFVPASNIYTPTDFSTSHKNQPADPISTALEYKHVFQTLDSHSNDQRHSVHHAFSAQASSSTATQHPILQTQPSRKHIPRKITAPMAHPLTNNLTNESTTSPHLLALEIAILSYPYSSPRLPTASKKRLFTILEQRRAQALGIDPDLFVRALQSARREWRAHWDVWSPLVTQPVFPADREGDDEETRAEKRRARRATLTRFAAEVVVLEWCVVDAGLEAEAVRTVVGTIEKCRGLGRGVHRGEFEEVLEETRRVWVGHWMGWASVDEGGSVEYGVLSGSGAGELMVGRMVVTEKTGDAEEGLIEREVLADRVVVEYARVRAEVCGEK
ncbi:hypothetical protein P171DRAFT_509762, partial [Karstenula rhodostoma CBS 690.94]